MKTLLVILFSIILFLSCEKQPKPICYECIETTIFQHLILELRGSPFIIPTWIKVSSDSTKEVLNTFCDLNDLEILQLKDYEQSNTGKTESYSTSTQPYSAIIKEWTTKCNFQ